MDRPVPTNNRVSERMRATRRRDTPGELALRARLYRKGFRYRVDAQPIAGVPRRADLVFKAAQVAVFIDGCFWHGCPEHGTWPKANGSWWRGKIVANRARDQDTDRQLQSRGWTVVRIWQHEAAEEAVMRVTAALHARAKENRPLSRVGCQNAGPPAKAGSSKRGQR